MTTPGHCADPLMHALGYYHTHIAAIGLDRDSPDFQVQTWCSCGAEISLDDYTQVVLHGLAPAEMKPKLDGEAAAARWIKHLQTAHGINAVLQ